ncbi:cytochrome P450 [Bisporella sp. PMI_857]|nr:cytochrome P450 [Bisporella sp. PMI_857]
MISLENYFLCVGAIAGIFMHHTVFIYGEWHIRAPKIVLAHGATLLCAAGTRTLTGNFDILKYTLWFGAGYLSSLYGSIGLYRVFFHRLSRANFPGPLYARVSKIPHVWACRNSKNHIYLDNLRKKYGDFVRTGPSEITCFHPDVFFALDGPRSESVKTDWYDILHPSNSLVTVRDNSVHAVLRRKWNRGFTAPCLTKYERKMVKHLYQLDHCIEEDALIGRLTNIKDLLFWFCTDCMGDFVFNQPLGLLKNQKKRHILKELNRALSLLGPLSPTPWLLHIAFKLFPGVSVVKVWFDVMEWSVKQMEKRLEIPEETFQERDFAHYILEDLKAEPENPAFRLALTGESLLAVVAGSHPVAASSIGVIFELARQPKHAEQIYKELQEIESSDVKAISKCTHFEACIKEGLRLHPALMTGGTRMTGDKGLTIAGRLIPPGIAVVPPRYIISQREDCFVKAKTFIPERWTTKPELILNKAAYSPFGTGHHSCVGKNLGLDAMRMVLAHLIGKYHIAFPPGETGEYMIKDLKDQFTSDPGNLRVIFKLREEKKADKTIPGV